MKKLFVFSRVAQVSDRYHSGGGLAIIADSMSDAKAMVRSVEYIEVTDREWNEAEVFSVEADQDRLWTFPDAGCC